KQEAYRASLEQLDAMVFVDPLFSPEDIDLYKCIILESWYERNSEILKILISAYKKMIEAYTNSKYIDQYRYKLVYFLILAGDFKEAQALMSFITSTDAQLEGRIEELKSNLNKKENGVD
ncbi:MAG: hypothetical protein AB1798_19855, partial [Spirochaetota bacterium]